MGDGPREGSAWLKPLLKLLIFTVLAPCSVTVWLPRWLYPSVLQWSVVEANTSTVVAAIVIALGAAGYLWCGWDFAFVGGGTPAPIDPPKILVARGVYRFVRNPMYVSVLLVLLGESLLFRSAILLRYAAIVWVMFHLVALLYEEPVLRRKFGSSYEEYWREVPRWIPRLRHRAPK